MSVENGYAECYPGLVEMEDAIGDSDEETDYRQEFPPESTRVGGGGELDPRRYASDPAPTLIRIRINSTLPVGFDRTR